MPGQRRTPLLVRVLFKSAAAFTLLAWGFSGLAPLTALAAAGVPHLLHHQGRLLDGSGNLLGGTGTNFCFRFSLFGDATPGAPDTQLWPLSNATPSTMTAQVKSGVFNVDIGDQAAGGDDLSTFDFQNTDTAFLNIDVANSVGGSCAGVSSFETLSPRERVVSSGYAINAESVGGFKPAQSATGSQIPVLSSGNLVLGGTNPQLNASGANTLTLQSGQTADLQFFSSANKLTSAGALTLAGTITSGSSAVPLTLSTGYIDANALTLLTGVTTSATTSTASGLESVANGITLLRGCADTQILKWNAAGKTWGCSADNSGGGSMVVQETDGTPSVNPASTLQFGPATTSSDEFVVTDQTGGVARIRLGTQVPLLNATESVTGAWTLSNAANSITAGTLTATGGSINGVTVGASSPSTGAFTTLSANNNVTLTSANITGASPLVFDGATPDVNKTTFAITDPTGARVITFPNATITVNAAADISGTTLASNVVTSSLTAVGSLASGSIASGFGTIATANSISTSNNILTTGSGTITSAGTLTASNGFTVTTGIVDATGATFKGASALVFDGATADSVKTTFLITDPTVSSKTITFPNATITVNAAADISGTTLASNVVTSSLTSVGTLTGLTMGGDIALGGHNITGGGTFTGAVSGNASTATALAANGANCSAGNFPLGVDALGAVEGCSLVVNAALTGYLSGAGTVASTDSIVAAIGKLNGNDALKLPLAGGTMSGSIAMGGNDITGIGSLTATGNVDLHSANMVGASPLSFDGATADAVKTIFAITDPTVSSKTITFPNATLTVNAAADISGTTLASNVVTSSLTTVGALATGSIVSGFTSINGTPIGNSSASTGAFSTLSSTGATNLATAGASNVTIATTGTGTVAIGNATGTFALTSNTLAISTLGALTGATGLTFASGNFDQSASAGTFKTGTGAVSLNGDVTIAAGKKLGVGVAPTRPLDVLNTATEVARFTNTTSGGAAQISIDNANAAFAQSILAFDSNSAEKVYWIWNPVTTSGNRVANTMEFYSNQATGGAGPIFRIADSAPQASLVIAPATGNVGIGDGSPASLLTVGNGDLFQVTSAGAIAAVVGITNTGAYSQTGTGAFSTGTGAVSLNGFTTVAKTIGADSATTNNLEKITFTTPADTVGTQTHQGLNIATTVGNATGGTNTANVIGIDAMTGDAQVTLNAINIGNLTGTAAAETAFNVGSGWDNVLSVNGTPIINGSGAVLSAGISGSYTGITAVGTLTGLTVAGAFSQTGANTFGTGTGAVSLNGDTTIAAGKFLQIGTNAGDLTGANGQISYNTSTNKFRCYQNGAWKDCDAASTLAIGNTVASGTAGSVLYVGSGPVLAQDNANFFWDATTHRLGIGDTTPAAALTVGSGDLFQVSSAGLVSIAPGTLADGAKALSITGTLPAAPTLTADATTVSITSAGSSATQGQRAMRVTLNAGYTGSKYTNAISTQNDAQGTGTGSGIGLAANYGISGYTDGVTAGHNIGVLGSGQFSSVLNVGLLGAGPDCTGTAICAGTWGQSAIQSGSPTVFGGWFGLTANSAIPTGNGSAALVASNGTIAAPIFIGYDNTTEVFRIADGGNVGIGTTGPSQKLEVSGNDGTGTGIIAKITNTNTSTASYATLMLQAGSGSSGGNVFGSLSNNDAYGVVNGLTISPGTNTQDIGFRSGVAQLGGTGSGPSVIIKASGNVGIGDITPASLLTVGNGDLFQVTSAGAIAAVVGITNTGAYSQTGTGTFGTGTGAVSLNGFTTVAKTIGADSATTNNLEKITFTTPADTVGTQTHQGLNIATTIGNATGGTNTANVIGIDAMTGDAQVTLNAISIGNLTGTAAAETAFNVGSGWDNVLSVNGTPIINGSGAVLSAGISGSYTGITAVGTLTGLTVAGAFSQTGANTFGTGTGAVSLNGDVTIAAGKFLQIGTNAGDLTGANGQISYNTSTNKFRCYQNGAWKDCDAASTLAIGNTVTSGTAGSILYVGTGPVLAQDNANFFWDATNKRLGIGTAAPSAPLEIYSSTETTGPDYLLINADNATGAASLALDRPSTSRYANLRFRTAGALNWEIQTRGDVTDVNSLVFRDGAGNNRVTLNSSGNFGIGTTNPDSMLTLGGTAHGYIRFKGPSINEGNIYHDATYGLHMDTSANALPIRIDGSALIVGMSGNVGIGDASPASLLTVGNGDLFQVTSAGLISTTPSSNSVALTLTGSSITSANLLNLDTRNTSGTISNEAFGAATTLAGALTGQAVDLKTNVTNAAQSVTGYSLTLPGASAASTTTIKGLSLASPGAFVSAAAATANTWTGLDLTMPAITQGAGSTVTSTGIKVTGGTVTSGTSYAFTSDLNAGNVGIGTATPGAKLQINHNGPGSDAYVWMKLSESGSVASYIAGDATTNAFVVRDKANLDRLTLTQTGNFGIGDTSPAAALTVGIGDLFQVTSAGAIAAVVGITNTGAYSQTGATTFGTGTGAVSLNGDVTIAAGKGLTFTSGVGTITQNYANTTGTASTTNVTASGASGANVVKGQSVAITGTANATGSNTVTGLDFPNVAAATNNTYYALAVGTGFTDALRVGGTQIINGSGVVQSAGLSGSYTGITGVGALTTGSIASGFGSIATTNTISTSNNISTTGTGTITSAGLLTASNGLTLTTGALNLTATSGNVDLHSANMVGASPLSFDGATADAVKTIFAITDPTVSSKTITFPDATITVNAAADISGTTLASNVVTSSLTTVGALASGSIASGFGTISTGNTITTTGTMGTAATTSFTGATGVFSTSVSTPSIISPANTNVAVTPNGSGSFVVNTDANSNMQVTASAVPTADILAITDGGNNSGTNGVDGLSVTAGSSNASGDVIHAVPSYTGGAVDALTYNVIEADAFSPTNPSGTDTVNGLKIGALTDPGSTITSNALDIGSGWDNVLTVNATPILNASGVLLSAGLSGTYSGALTLSNAANSVTVGTLTATGGTINGVAIGGSSTAAGAFTTLSSTGATNLATAGASNVTIATTGTGTVAIGNATGTFALTSNTLAISTLGALTGATGLTFASGNFDQSASAGTFKTGTGAVSINGDTTVAAGKNLVLAAGTGKLGVGLAPSYALDVTTSQGGGAAIYDTSRINFTSTGLTASGSVGVGQIISVVMAGTGVDTNGSLNGEVILTPSTTTGAAGITGSAVIFQDPGNGASLALQNTGSVTGYEAQIQHSPTAGTANFDTLFQGSLTVDTHAVQKMYGESLTLTPNVVGISEVNGLFLGNTGSQQDSTSTAIVVSSLWDNALSVNGAPIINGSGVLQSAGLSGTYSGSVALTGLTGLTMASGNVDLHSANMVGASPLSFDGATVDAVKTIFAITDPTVSSKTITFPDATITVNAAADISGTTLASNVVTSSLTTVGALNAGSITGGFGAIDTGVDNITTTGTIGTVGTTSFTGGTAVFTSVQTPSIISASGANVAVTPGGVGDFVVNTDADTNVQVTASAAPGVDMVAITNAGQASTTNGVDGLTVTFGTSDASGDGIHVVPSFSDAATGTLTYNAMEVGAFAPTNASAIPDYVNGLSVGAMTDPGPFIISSALDVATGWDNVLRVNGSPIINGSGVLMSAGLSGSYSGNVSFASLTGLTYGSGSYNFDQSASSGTFATGTGTVSLNGVTTVAANQNLILAAGTGDLGIGTASPITQLHVPGRMPTGTLATSATSTSPYSVYVQGRYAYVVDSGFIDVIDVSNSASPATISSTALTGSSGRDIYVQGRYAYVAEGSSQLEIFDVSNPFAPASVSITSASGAWAVQVQGRYAYVVGSNLLQPFDVSNPAAPVALPTVGTDAASEAGLFVDGRYAYVTNNFSASDFQIFDISNPAAIPAAVGGHAIAGNPYGIYVQGRYAYITTYSGGTLEVYDVSNPATVPAAISSYSVGGSNLGVQVQGRYAYIAAQSGGALVVVDVSNPASLVTVGSLASGSSRNLFVSGRYAYKVGEGVATLNVFDMGGAYVQQLEAGGFETGSMNVRNAFSAMDGSFTGGLTVSQGLEVQGGLSVNYKGTVTPGTAFALSANAVTTGTVESISATALTSGTGLNIAGGGANMTTGGALINAAMGAATAGNGITVSTTGVYTGTGLINVVDNAVGTLSGQLVNITSTTAALTTGSLLAVSSGTTGAVATNGIVSLVATGAYTSTSNAGLLDLVANSTQTGTVESISATALTSGTGLNIAGGGANMTTGGTGIAVALGAATAGNGITVSTTGVYTGTGLINVVDNAVGTLSGQLVNINSTTAALTTGSLLKVSSGTTGAVATNGIVSLVATGAYTSTSNAGLLDLVANSTQTGTVESISATALTSGVGLNIAGGGANMTTGGTGIAVALGAATAGNGITVSTTGVYTGTGLINVTDNAVGTLSGQLVNINSTTAALTTGSLLAVSSGTTGAVATNGIVNLTATGAYTSTSNAGLLDLVANSTQTGTVESISATALTSGTGLNIAGGGANMTTGGELINVAMGAATAGNGIAVSTTGVYTGTGLINVVDNAVGTMTGQLVNINSTTAAVTSGSLLAISTGTTGAVATNGIVNITATGAYTSTSNIGLLTLIANSTQTGTVERISATALTSGIGISIAGGGANMTAGGSLVDAALGAATAGNGVSVSTTGAYAGTGLVTITNNTTTASYAGIGLLLSNVATGQNTNSPKLVLQGNGFTAAATNATGTFYMQTQPLSATTGKLMFGETGFVAAQTVMSITQAGVGLIRGGITTGTPDLAENIPVSDPSIEAGDIVSVDTVALGDGTMYDNVKTKKSSQPYDQGTVGVISTSPGILLGIPKDAMETDVTTLSNDRRLTLAGRTPVKVTDENGPIHKGDLLTSSSTPGVAMKATHAGPVIGQALEDEDTSFAKGMILVLVHTGYFDGESADQFVGPVDPTAAPSTLASRVLAKFLADQAAGTSITSELLTGRIAAGIEIVTPSVTTQGLTVDTVTALHDVITFQSDLAFIGRPYFNADMGGFVVIKKGASRGTVAFDKEYLTQPVVNASISLEDTGDAALLAAQEAAVFTNNVQYIVTGKTTKGFTITLNKAAAEDIRFSWMALAVKDAKVIESTDLGTTYDATASSTTSTSSTTTASGFSAGTITPTTTTTPDPTATTTSTDPTATPTTTTTDPTATTSSTSTTTTDPTATTTTTTDPTATTTTTVTDPTATTTTTDPTATTSSTSTTTTDPTATTTTTVTDPTATTTATDPTATTTTTTP